MEATLKVLNKMEEAGVIQSYAIGGAVGAAFYVEPSLTYDLDVFALIESSAVIDLSPLYRMAAGTRAHSQRGGSDGRGMGGTRPAGK